MIFAARQTGKPYDNGSFTVAQLSYMDQVREWPHHTPYGFFSMPPIKSTWCIFPFRDNDNDMFGFGQDYVNRPKDLKEGDVCIFNTISKIKFVFKTDGSVDAYAPENINYNCKNFNITATESVKINAPDFIVNGDTTMNGNLTVIGTIIGDIIKSLGELFWATVKAVSTHTHGAGPPPN